MKRILVIGVALATLLTMAGCKSKEPVSTNQGPSGSVSTQVDSSEPVQEVGNEDDASASGVDDGAVSEPVETEPVYEMPEADSGIFSALKPSDKVEDPSAYMDGVYMYLSENWPEQMTDETWVRYDSYGYWAIDLEEESDTEEMLYRFSMSFNDDERPDNQTLNITWKYSMDDINPATIVDTVYEYTGIQYDVGEVEAAMLAIADNTDTVLTVGNCCLGIGEYPFSSDDVPTVAVKFVFYDDTDDLIFARKKCVDF